MLTDALARDGSGLTRKPMFPNGDNHGSHENQKTGGDAGLQAGGCSGTAAGLDDCPAKDAGRLPDVDGARARETADSGERGSGADALPLKYGLPRKGYERGVYVYIANDFPFFKVGSSRQMRMRLAALKWVMPGGMRLLAWWPLVGCSRGDLRDVEIDLQARLERFSAQGEWFRADPEALALIAKWQERRPRPVKTPPKYHFSTKHRRRWLARHHEEISK